MVTTDCPVCESHTPFVKVPRTLQQRGRRSCPINLLVRSQWLLAAFLYALSSVLCQKLMRYGVDRLWLQAYVGSGGPCPYEIPQFPFSLGP